MKKLSFSLVALFMLFMSHHAIAAEQSAQQDQAAASATTATVMAKTDSTEGAASEPVATPAVEKPATTAPATEPASETPVEPKTEEEVSDEKASENLEFVSGEINAVDEATKTVTVKLYGETEKSTGDKVISVKVNDSTDITDGEADRDLKSLTPSTEVDVEYDPATNIATYIFVY